MTVPGQCAQRSCPGRPPPASFPGSSDSLLLCPASQHHVSSLHEAQKADLFTNRQPSVTADCFQPHITHMFLLFPPAFQNRAHPTLFCANSQGAEGRVYHSLSSETGADRCLGAHTRPLQLGKRQDLGASGGGRSTQLDLARTRVWSHTHV